MASDGERRNLGRFDYIVVGAGSAGCVLANRLSADPANRVLLLEAGGSDRMLPWVHIPIGYLYSMGNPRTDWCFSTAAEAGLNGRSIPYPRGKLLGGCSSINGMIYMRGQARDYDLWRQQGNPGWGWDDVLPYFRKSEDHASRDDAHHGQGGEQRVERQRLSWPILDAVREAAEELGVPQVEDFNSGTNEGSSYFEVTQRRGIRQSAASAFLTPVRRRPNLTIVTGAQAERLVMTQKRVTGVAFARAGARLTASAEREVVLAAGAVGSPHLLQLSGIGDGELLGKNDVKVRHHLPDVGRHLQDHLQIRSTYRIENARTLNERQASLAGKIGIGLEYALFRTGPMSMAPSQLGIFTRSHGRYEEPNIEYHVQPLSLDRFGEPLHDYPALTVSVCNLRPTSRGAVELCAPDPRTAPAIRPHYLSTDEDRDVAVASLRHARRLMATSRMAEFRPREVLPGLAIQDDEGLLKAAGDIATTIFHPVGTCRMGPESGAVVDPELRVHGLSGLRVADASIMPAIVSGNTHAPVVMIAEKAADMMLADRSRKG